MCHFQVTRQNMQKKSPPDEVFMSLIMANVQEIWTYNTGRMPSHRGDIDSDVCVHCRFDPQAV